MVITVFVSQVLGDVAFAFDGCLANECGVDEAIFWGVILSSGSSQGNSYFWTRNHLDQRLQPNRIFLIFSDTVISKKLIVLKKWILIDKKLNHKKVWIFIVMQNLW